MVKQVIAGFILWFGLVVHVTAGTLSTDLYRLGNASSPKMDNARPSKDVETFQKNNITWVKGKRKGVSTTSEPYPTTQRNVWKIAKGKSYPNDLYVYNDTGNHWSWAPAKDMPYSTYVDLLKQTNSLFIKVQ